MSMPLDGSLDRHEFHRDREFSSLSLSFTMNGNEFMFPSTCISIDIVGEYRDHCPPGVYSTITLDLNADPLDDAFVKQVVNIKTTRQVFDT